MYMILLKQKTLQHFIIILSSSSSSYVVVITLRQCAEEVNKNNTLASGEVYFI